MQTPGDRICGGKLHALHEDRRCLHHGRPAGPAGAGEPDGRLGQPRGWRGADSAALERRKDAALESRLRGDHRFPGRAAGALGRRTRRKASPHGSRSASTANAPMRGSSGRCTPPSTRSRRSPPRTFCSWKSTRSGTRIISRKPSRARANAAPPPLLRRRRARTITSSTRSSDAPRMTRFPAWCPSG